MYRVVDEAYNTTEEVEWEACEIAGTDHFIGLVRSFCDKQVGVPSTRNVMQCLPAACSRPIRTSSSCNNWLWRVCCGSRLRQLKPAYTGAGPQSKGPSAESRQNQVTEPVRHTSWTAASFVTAALQYAGFDIHGTPFKATPDSMHALMIRGIPHRQCTKIDAIPTRFIFDPSTDSSLFEHID